MDQVVYDRVVRVMCAEVGHLTGAQVTPQANLVIDLGMDSLDRGLMVMGLEEEFGLQFSDAEVERVKTVADVVQWIEEKREIEEKRA